MLTRSRLRFLNALVSAILLLLCAMCAGAQTMSAEDLTRSLVFTEQAAYQRGERMLLGTGEASVFPDPRGRYALISCGDAPQAPIAREAAPVVACLLLYDSVTGRVKTIWQQDAADQSEWTGAAVDIDWLPQTDTALAIVVDRWNLRQKSTQTHPKLDCSLLLLRAPLGFSGVRRLLQGEDSMRLYPSPNSPFAMVHEMTYVPQGTSSYDTRWMSVDEHGTLGPALPLGPYARGGDAWDDAGTTTYFNDRVPIDAAPNADANDNAAPGSKPKTRTQRYAFNVQTQALTPTDDRPKAAARPAPPAEDGPLCLVQGAFTAVPPGNTGAQPLVKPETIAPLWLVRSDKKSEKWQPTATLIAPDAQECFLLADNSAVLYITDGAAYAVPLTRQPRPDFDTRFLQYVTQSRAKQIVRALFGYSQLSDGRFPPSDSYSTALVPYVSSNDIFNNPATGQPGFTYLLNGDGIATMSSPATTMVGYLAGPGGRAVLYADGHSVWEDAPSSPPSP